MGEQKSFKILIVDDDRDILELLEYNLEKEGFKVRCVSESTHAIKAASDFNPDLIILDIMMPHPNGIELCRELRKMNQFTNTYIFFLTAKSENYYQQAALDTGGDDYIEKVMGLRSLTFKVSTVLKRRFVIRKSVPEVRLGNMSICRRTRSVKLNGNEISLSKPEFDLLFFFAQNPHRTISLDNILRNIWGSEMYMLDSAIDGYIHNLKQKLGIELIHPRSGNAYRFSL